MLGRESMTDQEIFKKTSLIISGAVLVVLLEALILAI